MFSPLLIPILGISCGLLAIFGGVVVRPWLRFQERKLEVEADLMRSRATLDAARHERLEQRVRCSSGSSPTAAWAWPMRLSGCATRR